MELTQILDRPAVILKGKQSPPHRVIFVEGDVCTAVDGDTNFDAVWALAEEIARRSSLTPGVARDYEPR